MTLSSDRARRGGSQYRSRSRRGDCEGGETLTEAASLREERSTDGRFLVRLEIVLAEPKHDGRFADGRLACVPVVE